MTKINKIQNIILGIFVGIILCGLLAIFSIIALGVMANEIMDMDVLVCDWIVSIRTPVLNVIFFIITNFSNPLFVGLFAIVLVFIAKNKRNYVFGLFLNMGLVSGLNLLLKAFFVRPRPDPNLSIISEVGFSFPSGHAMLSLAFYGFLIFFVAKLDWKKSIKILLSILMSMIILLIGFSRIYLGVHYTSDVIGAYAITLVYFIIFMFVFSRQCRITQIDKEGYKKHSLLQGFKYAFRGIVRAFRDENNLFIQFAITMIVIVFGVFLRISPIEWAICLLLCFLVMSLEIVNTAIENVCDKITLDRDRKIGRIKDISAGAVLMMSIGSVVVAMTIFLPKIYLLFI